MNSFRMNSEQKKGQSKLYILQRMNCPLCTLQDKSQLDSLNGMLLSGGFIKRTVINEIVSLLPKNSKPGPSSNRIATYVGIANSYRCERVFSIFNYEQVLLFTPIRPPAF